jgi:hypothetical protein
LANRDCATSWGIWLTHSASPSVRREAPPRLELTLRQRDHRPLVTPINRGAGDVPSPRRVVEELPPVEHVERRVRREGPPRRVVAVPADRPLEREQADGVLFLRLPWIDVHTVAAPSSDRAARLEEDA